MNKQWIIRLAAVVITLLMTACELGGGVTTTNTDSTYTNNSGTTYTTSESPSDSVAGTGIIPDSGQTSCYYDITIEDFNGDGIDDYYDPSQIYCVDQYAAWQPFGQDGNYTSTYNAMSYTDNGDGTVLDNITGLTWQKCAMGETGSDCSGGTIGSYSWSSALTACTNSTLAGGGWRLPNVTELMGIVDYEQSMGTIDNTSFPGGTVSPYWTSTPHATYSTWAWYISFSQGQIMTNDKTSYYYVRCVR